MKLKHTPFQIDDKRLMNLLTLAYYLKFLPKNYDKFDMSRFCTFDKQDEWAENVETASGAEEALHNCGTAACALGHGPNAGIRPKKDESWWYYSDRCFMSDDSAEWDWCFSGRWENTDNTVKGAANRIMYLIEKGLPENWKEQLNQYAPLSYKK